MGSGTRLIRVGLGLDNKHYPKKEKKEKEREMARDRRGISEICVNIWNSFGPTLKKEKIGELSRVVEIAKIKYGQN